MIKFIKNLFQSKEIRYIIVWNDTLDYLVLYKSFEEANEKRLKLSPNEGKICRVDIRNI